MLAAAFLFALTAVIHVFVGGPEVIGPLRQARIDPVAAAVLMVVWHMVTLLLCAAALALAHLTWHRNVAMAVLLTGLMAGTAVIFIAFGLSRLGSLWPMPQWSVFALLAALIALGLRRG